MTRCALPVEVDLVQCTRFIPNSTILRVGMEALVGVRGTPTNAPSADQFAEDCVHHTSNGICDTQQCTPNGVVQFPVDRQLEETVVCDLSQHNVASN